ncbi:hypothetical protein BJ944DRAFT_265058 [Cunninghamella echinulata]|nr:hypothetical protein BJ944DRAFT_265058 [Cunninghamella echinulata]
MMKNIACIFLLITFAILNVSAWSFSCAGCLDYYSHTGSVCKALDGKLNGHSCYSVTKYQACTQAPKLCKAFGCGDCECF